MTCSVDGIRLTEVSADRFDQARAYWGRDVYQYVYMLGQTHSLTVLSVIEYDKPLMACRQDLTTKRNHYFLDESINHG